MIQFLSRRILVKNKLLNFKLNRLNQLREFKSKNVLFHRKGNNIPLYLAIERIMYIVMPICIFYVWYDPDYPDSFVNRFLGFQDIEDAADETGETKRTRKKIKYSLVPLEDNHKV